MSNGSEFEAKNSGLLKTKWLTAEAADEVVAVAVAVDGLLEIVAEDEGCVGVAGVCNTADVEESVIEHRDEMTLSD